MFGVVEDEDVTAGRFSGNDAGVLRHEPGTVDFPLVIDLDFDLDFTRDGSESAELAFLVVVVGRVELGVLVWQLY